MQRSRTVVLGAGVAGLATALLLARDGHDVLVVERDELPLGEATQSPSWPRKGIPHFLQPHAFRPRGRRELIERLPDVYAALIDAGAQDVDLRAKLPGPAVPEDADLQFMGVRRPLIEWALRRAVAAEDRIEVRPGVEVTGLRVEGRRVTGVAVGGAEVPSTLVVDALGRRMRTVEWLAANGLAEVPAVSSDCGVVYYSRYYRLVDGFELPDGPWLVGPRGDLGYMGFATFPGDNRTFAALLAVPPGWPTARAFRQPMVFEAAVASIPSIAAWVDPAGVEPITDVLTMAGLRNSIRDFASAQVSGLIPLGDAACHSDPVLALGLSFALLQAGALVDSLRATADLDDAAASFHEHTGPLMAERFGLASRLDAQRLRMWNGEPVDFATRNGDYELFTIVAGGVAALSDPDVFRTVARRDGLLESVSVLDDDEAMQRRIETLFAEATATPRPPGGPTRDEMVAIAGAALAGAGVR